MLEDRCDQRQRANGDHRKADRHGGPLPTEHSRQRSARGGKVFEEFHQREAETDHGQRGTHPGHQRALGRQEAAFLGQVGTLLGQLRGAIQRWPTHLVG